MLPAKYRFHGHGSLRYVYSKGQVVRSKHFLAKSIPNKHRTQPRVAVVVSKKIMKSAVKRNRIRRRLYEAIRTQLPVTSVDIVFIVTSPEVMTAPVDELHQFVKRSFSQLTPR